MRILLCVEPIEHLREMFPPSGIRERVEAGAELLGSASSLRFTNPHGTDVVYDLGAYPVITQYGYTDTPGRWDHWPSGSVHRRQRRRRRRHGRHRTGRHRSRSSPTCRPRSSDDRGRPDRAHRGRPGHADLLRDYMASFRDEKAYGIAHIGWGMLETAKWGILAADRRGMGMHGRSYYGNVLFSTGPNAELGGTNDTLCPVDIPMRGCSLFLDDRPIVVDGDIVVEELKAPTAQPA